MAKPQLLLVDGHAVAFRAFHALHDANLRSLATGEPTYAVFGFCQILLTQLQKMSPEYAAIAFDRGHSFRDQEFSGYKATRGHAPEEFHSQLERIKQVVRSLNIPIYEIQHYEADDVIGTLARQATERAVETFILTGDTDTLQLVDEHVHVLLSVPYRQAQEIKEYDLAAVRERYGGLEPHQLTDLRGLKGDTSDNIPGVKGIGEQGAITLLKQWTTIETLYEHLPEVGKRYLKALDGQQQIALLSKRLATIQRDVAVDLDLNGCRLRDYDRQGVIALFRELEFGRLINKLPLVGEQPDADELPATPVAPADAGYTLTRARPRLVGAAAQQDAFDLAGIFGPSSTDPSANDGTSERAPDASHYRTVRTTAQLAELVTALKSAPHWSFDTETDGLEELRSNIVGISFATEPGRGWYVPVGHTQPDQEQLPAAAVRAALQPLFEDGKQAKVGHNSKFDILVLRRWGCEVHGVVFDTMIAAQLLGKRGGLKDLALYELNIEMTEITDLIGKGKTQITFDAVPIDRATPYAAADADLTLQLHDLLTRQLAAVPPLEKIFHDIEMPLIPVLADMEWTGITIDVTVLHQIAKLMQHRLATIETEMASLAGQPFNPNSSQQVSDLLFGKQQLPTAGLAKTKSGHYSITADVLDKLRGTDPLVEKILEHRQITKLKTTYVDALPLLVDERGRVHTSYNQLGASTGRLSSQNPNLQNIPIRTEQGREIRRAFVPEQGWYLIAADYSQVELRILAHASEDPALLDIFKQNLDIHTATAARLFGVPINQVTKQQRRLAKTVVFGVVYGISAFGLSARTDLSRADAQQMIDGLFQTYPALRAFFDRTLEDGRVCGYVQTLLGRRRNIPDLVSANGSRRQAAEREAINAPMQGTSADFIKLAMVKLHNEMTTRALQARLLLQVHDELVLEAPEQEVEEVKTLVCSVMEHVYPTLKVPLEVHVAAGKNWDAMDE
ncbi:MAG: DNA polymerase I [Herpetosiphon sp.]